MLNHIENYIDPISNKYSVPQPTALAYVPSIFVALYVDSTNLSETMDFLNIVFKITYLNINYHVYDASENEYLQKWIEANEYVYHANEKNYVWKDFIASDNDFYFLLEKRCIVTNKNILDELVSNTNDRIRIVSPMMKHYANSAFTNFWGDIGSNGFYKRSVNYFDIVEKNLTGLWNVPHVSGAILIRRDVILNYDLSEHNKYSKNNIDMALSLNMRKATLFMYVLNTNDYGYLTS